MEVLRYDTDDYTIQVSTKDLSLSYRKFCGRIGANADRYCSYASSSLGSLRLSHPVRQTFDEVPFTEWSAAWPVFFETQAYNFTVTIRNVLNGSRPRVVHPSKEVEELFNVVKGSGCYMLCGAINFLNEPGRFSLQFVYVGEDGRERREGFDFDVVSPKLDTKDDLKEIIKQLRCEYNDLVFRYLTLTFQQFSAGKEVNNELIWLSVFKTIVNKYLLSVRYVLHAPHNKEFRREEFCRPDRVKQWSSALAERFCNDFKKDSESTLRSYYHTERTENTNDTTENRFVKYSLDRISERLRRVLLKVSDLDISDSERKDLRDYLQELNTLQHNTFWRNIGRFDGFRQESMVLQQRNGYAQVYRGWLLLQNGLDLVSGSTSIGVQPIWKLYELWCFLEIKRMSCGLLGIDPHNPEDIKYINDKSRNAFELFKGGDLSGTLELTNKHNGDKIEIGYQYTYARDSIRDDLSSMTVEQRPDIVMNVHKANGFVLTYLFDAKYRVKGEESNESLVYGDYPEDDTLNQMHRYRDAIYYGSRKTYNFSKEVIGGYILFPGRLDEQGILDGSKAKPYYVKSIESVNIGAFPLLPNESSGLLLREHLRKIILEISVLDQIKDAVPQKGLQYHAVGNGNGVAMVMMENFDVKSPSFANGKVAIPVKLTETGMELMENLNNISYVLFHTRNADAAKHLFRITSVPRVVKAGNDEMANYYPIQKSAKRYILVDIADDELPSNDIDPSKDNVPYASSEERYDAQYMELNQLEKK